MFKSILTVLLFSAKILLFLFGITWDVDWRAERLEKRAQLNKWLCDRALNEYQVSLEKR